MWHIVKWLFVILIETDGLTTINGTTPFQDDFVFVPTNTFGDDAWSRGHYGDNITNNLLHTTLTPAGETMWGWWPKNSEDWTMLRRFGCESYGQARISFDVYFCCDTTSGTIQVMYENFYTDTKIAADYFQSTSIGASYNSNPPEGFSCTSSIKRATVTEGPFDVGPVAGVGANQFEVRFSWKHTGSQVSIGDTDNVAGFNNFQVNCTTDPTIAPTFSPTLPTSQPSQTPSVTPSESPSRMPTQTPTAYPTAVPTTDNPSAAPVTEQPTEAPTTDPTGTPTEDPTTDPSPMPVIPAIVPPSKRPTPAPVRTISFGEKVENAFGGGSSDCADGWVQCNLLVFILLLIIIIVFILYWILGAVWYKRRQDNRPLPPHMMNQGQGGVEMGGGATGAAHTTANKWKSAWELEQEAKSGNTGDTGNTGDAQW